MTWVEWFESGAWQESKDTVPMVPSVARDVLDMASDPTVTARRISSVVNRDPVLATRVLQLANSAFSASAVSITSINDAVVRMGTDSVRNVVTAVCVASLMGDERMYGTHGRALIDHGIGTAYLAAMIAEVTRRGRDEAFATGLLHDIGKLFIMQLAHRPAFGMKKASPEELSAIVAARHAECGGFLLSCWQLPASLAGAVAHHHTPEQAPGDTGAATVAYVANRLAYRYGFGCPVEEFDPLADPLIAGVGIDAETLARLDHQAPRTYQMAKQLAA